MFDDIINYLKDSKDIINAKKMARDLGTEESALEVMLDFLVKKKKLSASMQYLNDKKGKCTGCALCSKGKGDKIKYYYLPKD
jgi:hypothetical protein